MFRKFVDGTRTFINRAYYYGSGRKQVLDDVDRMDALFKSSREEIDAYSHKQLAEILRHAARTVPYYRDYLNPDTIDAESALDVLSDLPIMTKGVIREQGSRLFSDAPGARPFQNSSGGSTGKPIQVLQDKDMTRAARSFEFLFMRWAGHEMGRPHFLIWAVPEELLGEKVPLHERIFRLANNETYLDCSKMTDALMEQWVAQINARKPSLIEAYVDVIALLCRYIRRKGIKVWSPNGIISSAGVLTPEARSLISETFKCTVINRYGSRDANNVACSCSENTELHINEALCLIEIADDAGQACAPGEEGDILVTLFINRTMPLLRYRIEDRGILATGTKCKCGRKTKRLVNVCGRVNDYLVSGSGTKIQAAPLTMILADVDELHRFQYRQSSLDCVSLAVVPVKGCSVADLEKALAKPVQNLQELLHGVEIQVDILDDIPPSNSGKYRPIINELND